MVAAGTWYALTRRAAPGGSRAIAVLPFENASGDSTLDYLAEGMSDEVRSQLTEIPGLSVRARSSSQAFRGRRVDLAEVGAKLGVSEVLQASVRAAAGRLHVTAELVRIADGTALWSHAFDGQAASLATVQDSITRAIAGALRLRLREGLADAPGVAGDALAAGTPQERLAVLAVLSEQQWALSGGPRPSHTRATVSASVRSLRAPPARGEPAGG